MENRIKLTKVDKETGLTFSIEQTETGKYCLRTVYNGVRVNPEWYEFGVSGIETLLLLLTTAKSEIDIANIGKILKPNKNKKRKKK